MNAADRRPEALRDIDLNLLALLDALLEERHVTRAAKRVGISQSAMSHALSRLRELFGDPLLVRGAQGMMPTPRAEALREPLSRTLAELARFIREDARFDAKTSTRTYALACPDLLASALPELLSAMSAEAPRVCLEVRPQAGDLSSELGAGACDLALAPARSEGAGLRTKILGRVRWVVLARPDHPARQKFDLGAWTRYPHIQVRIGTPGPSFVDRALARIGASRTIGLVVPGFLVAPEVVARTDHFFTAPRELVRGLAERLDLAMLDPPIDLPDIPIAALWHERVHDDPAHAWFRGVVARVIEAALAPSAR